MLLLVCIFFIKKNFAKGIFWSDTPMKRQYTFISLFFVLFSHYLYSAQAYLDQKKTMERAARAAVRSLHKTTVARSQDNAFKCSKCPRSFKKTSHLNDHDARAHTRVRKHQCNICKKRFFRKDEVARHSATCNNIKRFKCNVPPCGARFYRRDHQVMHVRTVHKLKPYKCTFCKHRFAKHKEWKEHTCNN